MLRKKSLLFWCTLVVPMAMIAIGINFILNPSGAAAAYGIPIHDPAAFPFMWIKGIRDISSGLVILPFLWKGDCDGIENGSHRLGDTAGDRLAADVVRARRSTMNGRWDATRFSSRCVTIRGRQKCSMKRWSTSVLGSSKT